MIERTAKLVSLVVVVAWTAAILAADSSANKQQSTHWAHQRLSHVSPPETLDSSWAAGPIDRFLQAEWETRGMRPVADASPLDLLRRLSVQLTGLPPTQAETQQFLMDQRPDARQRLVDRLLSSPRFGERFGRHWLDLARYADSNGLDENFLFREAWRYRNWVRDAVNADMTFDRFLLEQIAGDLLPFDSTEQRDRQRIAAGFIVIGPKVLLGNNDENQKMEVADELLDTIGRAVLGQTLGCARCHDHKFDPVPTADYYALAGIFSSTKVMERRFMLGEQRVMERLVGLGDEGDRLDEEYERYYRQLPELREKAKQAEAALNLLRQARDEVFSDSEYQQFREYLAADADRATLPIVERIEAQSKFVGELKSQLANPPKIPPRAMIPTDVQQPSDEYIRISGQFDQRGEKVPRGFLSVLCDGDRIAIPDHESGRIGLARWLCDARQPSGQLAARVLANRLWHHLFGRGLVRTVDNFGVTGEPPSHPELLDYLAQRLIASEWSIKEVVREMVLSRTFALSSQVHAAGQALDPENRLLWRANRRRLDPESFRDALLQAADALDLTPMDSTVWYLHDQATAVGGNPVRRRTDFPCRSYYLPVIRNDLPEIFEALDFTNPHVTTGARPNTTAPGQALFVLNDELVMSTAEQCADRLMAAAPSQQPRERAAALFRRIAGREPSPAILDSMLQYIETTQAQLVAQGAERAERQAWTRACHALFASSRFQYLE